MKFRDVYDNGVYNCNKRPLVKGIKSNFTNLNTLEDAFLARYRWTLKQNNKKLEWTD